LALGIGANTAIFSILNSLLLKPLPVHDPQQLIALGSDQPGEDAAMTYPIWQEVRDRHLLNGLFVWATDRVSIADGGETRALEAIWASGTFFDSLGLPAVAGRTFTESDDRRDAGPNGPVAVLSHAASRRLFGGPAGALGRSLTIERVPFTIIGVTPREFFGLNVGAAVDVILPLETEPTLSRIPSRLERWPWLHITARLRPGETVEAATAAVRTQQPQIREATLPYSRAQDRQAYLSKPWTMRSATTGSSRLRSRYGTALSTLLVIVGLVLLVACANIAHLQLARTAARRYEFSVRAALGASRLRIVRQQLVESLLLAAAGAALGLAFAQWGGRLIVAQLSTWASTAFLDLSPDWRVLAVTGAVALATAILFGTVPALRAARVDPIEALNQHRRGLTAGGFASVGGGLVVVQVALSLLLVIGAGLFVRSFAALAYRDLGFDRSRVVVAVVDARRSAVPPASFPALFERVRQAVATVPGVESAATSMATPLGSAGVRFDREVQQAGNPTFAGGEVRIFTCPVSPDWFRTFGTRLLAGRDFEGRDRAGSQSVAMINEAFARRHFGGESPIGRTIMVGDEPSDRQPVEIVGLVQNAAFTSVREPVAPTLYRPLAQWDDERLLKSFPSVSVSIRAAGNLAPARLSTSVASAISGVDGALTVSFQSLTETLSVYYIRERLLALISGYFGLLALLLAALGLYGVTSYSVSQRRTEIGVRMAIGADGSAVVRLVLGRVAFLCAFGIVAGVIASVWATRLVEALLFNTPARDPLLIGGSAVALALVAAVAGWLPARRASRIDPAEALRQG
jgi:predicted permease